MILKEFPIIVMDELPPKPDPKNLYFLSRPMVHTTVYNETNPISIITTKKIRKFLISGNNPIPAEYIVGMDKGTITLAGRDVRFHVIHSGSLCCNVMFMFYYCDKPQKQILYTGQFSEFGNFFDDAQLREAIRQKTIATMYIDNTMASAANDLSISKTAEMINDIQRKYPHHRIIVWTEPLGCEILFELLSTEYGLKVHLNGTRGRLIKLLGKTDLFWWKQSPDILVIDDLPSYKLETYNDAFNNKKQIILRLVRAEQMIVPNILEKWNGIIDIPHSPHPSARMIQLLFHRIKPQNVFLTAEYNGDLPSHLLSSGTTQTENVFVEDENSGFHCDEAYENEYNYIFGSNATDGHRVSDQAKNKKKRDCLSLTSDELDSAAMSDVDEVTFSPPEKRRKIAPDRINKRKDAETNQSNTSNATDSHRVSNEPSPKKRDILSLTSDEHDSPAMSDIDDVTTSPPEKRRKITTKRNNKKRDEDTNGKPSVSNGDSSDVVKFINRSRRVNATANRIIYIDSTSDEEEDFGRDDRSVTISIGSSSPPNPY